MLRLTEAGGRLRSVITRLVATVPGEESSMLSLRVRWIVRLVDGGGMVTFGLDTGSTTTLRGGGRSSRSSRLSRRSIIMPLPLLLPWPFQDMECRSTSALVIGADVDVLVVENEPVCAGGALWYD